MVLHPETFSAIHPSMRVKQQILGVILCIIIYCLLMIDMVKLWLSKEHKDSDAQVGKVL
jgi:hypothetical protein